MGKTAAAVVMVAFLAFSAALLLRARSGAGEPPAVAPKTVAPPGAHAPASAESPKAKSPTVESPLPAASATAKPAPDRGSARLTVLGGDGKPLEGAEVALREQRVDGDPVSPRTAKSDASGVAAFADLPAGGFEVLVSAPGHARMRNWVRVEAGREATREFRLERGDVLLGRVLAAPGREPIAGARIEARGSKDWMSLGPPLASAMSDADGRFRLAGVPLDEEFTVHAAATGRVEEKRRARLAADGSGEKEVEILLLAGGCIEGVVRDAQGNPVAGALVAVAEWDPDEKEPYRTDLIRDTNLSTNGNHALTAETGKDGTFAVEGLALGAVYAAMAHHGARRSTVESGMSPTEAEPRVHRDLRVLPGATLRVRILGPDGKPPTFSSADFPGEGYDEDRWKRVGPGTFEATVAEPGPKKVVGAAHDLLYGVKTVEIPAEGTVEVEFRLEEGAAIEGVVVDQAGKPVAGVGIEPSPVDRDEDDGFGHDPSGVSDAEGRFRVKGLKPGVHRINTRVGEDFRIDGESLYQAPSTGVRVVVASAGAVSLRLRLPEGAVPPDEIRFGWTVKTENGHSGSFDRAPWKDGTFRWDGQAPGKKVLSIEAKGFRTLTFPIEIPSGGDLDLGEAEFRPSSRLEVRVVDAKGAPIAGAQVRGTADPDQMAMLDSVPIEFLNDFGGGAFSLTTGEDGRASSPFGGGAFAHISVTMKGYLPATAKWEAATAAPVTVVLRRGGELRVDVLLPDGSRPKMAVFLLTEADGTRWPRSGGNWLQRGEGPFHVRIGAGRWKVEVSESEEEGKPRGSAEAVVEEDGTTDVSIRLER